LPQDNYVLDRGGNRCSLLNPLLDNVLGFIIQLVGNRHLAFRGRNSFALDLAKAR